MFVTSELNALVVKASTSVVPVHLDRKLPLEKFASLRILNRLFGFVQDFVKKTYVE